MASEINVTINNWERFNPRKDVTNPTWFRLSHSFFEDPDFFGFTHAEMLVWIYLLTLASKKNSKSFTVNIEHADRVARLPQSIILPALKKLAKNRCIELRTLRGRYANVTDANATNKTNEHNETRQDETESANAAPCGALPPLAEIWNSNCGDLPRVRECRATRRRSAEARWRERPNPEAWAEIVRRIAASPFCTGTNDRGWRADFDFLIKSETATRVLEGKYDARKPGKVVTGKFQRGDDLDSEIGSLIGGANQ